MKPGAILFLIIILLCRFGKAQNLSILVWDSALRDSTAIENYTLKPVGRLENPEVFKGCKEKTILTFEYAGKEFLIPIKSWFRELHILPNPEAAGHCNIIVEHPACDLTTFVEHGNGCKVMNLVEVNTCSGKPSGVRIDGSRIMPFYYPGQQD